MKNWKVVFLKFLMLHNISTNFIPLVTLKTSSYLCFQYWGKPSNIDSIKSSVASGLSLLLRVSSADIAKSHLIGGHEGPQYPQFPWPPKWCKSSLQIWFSQIMIHIRGVIRNLYWWVQDLLSLIRNFNWWVQISN